MFRFTKKIFIRLLASAVSVSSHIKSVSLGNQKCEIQRTLINLRFPSISLLVFLHLKLCFDKLLTNVKIRITKI